MIVKGAPDVWVKLAKCCTPVPPDDILGFVTQGGGVSVHRTDCTNAAELRRIADVVDKYAIPTVKVTGGQRIDLLGVPKEDLPQVWADLDMPSGYAYAKAVRTAELERRTARSGTSSTARCATRWSARS